MADLVALPIEAEKRDLWRRHNRLEHTRPLVYCSPENAWTEIFPPDRLKCAAPVARDWELHLRKQVFYGRRMGDDYTIPAFFSIGYVHDEPDWGLAEQRVGGENGTAYTWISPIESEADVDKLHLPVIRVDFAATQRLASLASDIFGDVLPVRIKTAGYPYDTLRDLRLKSVWWDSMGLTAKLANLRGLQRMLYDMVDAPELIHLLMGKLRDGTLAMLQALEDAHLLSLNNDATYIASGGLGWSDELPQPDHQGVTRICDLWGFAESQETIGVSPRMFERFIFPYQLPILERFGLNCYGCCEPVDNRWPIFQHIPRLRRVSVSPWSNREAMARNLEDRYVFSMKPNPADLAMETFDEDRIRKDIRRDLETTKGCCLEILMKDNHTIRHDPERLIRWVQIVRQEIDRVWQ